MDAGFVKAESTNLPRIDALMEKLTAERLARARAEEEVQHLRACIEERDEKAFEEEASNDREDVISLCDSDRDSDEEVNDPCNESLEPTFKKEDINRSRLVTTCVDNNSLHYDSTEHSFHDNTEQTKENFGSNSVLHSSHVTLKDNDKSSEEINEKDNSTKKMNLDNLCQESYDNNETASTAEVEEYSSIAIDNDVKLTENANDSTNKCDNLKINTDVFINVANNKDILNSPCFEKESIEAHAVKELENDKVVSKSIVRGTYFVSDANINSAPETFEEDLLKRIPMKVEKNESVDTISTKVSETIVTKIIKSVEATHVRNTSLAQFEQLEKAANYCDNTKIGCNDFGNVKILKEKRTYFDDNPLDIVKMKIIKSPKANKDKKTYFDNIDGNTETSVSKKEKDTLRDVNKQLDDTRSPSIVKDEVLNDYKPSTLKILLGENLTRQPDVITSVHTNNLISKKHDSIDIFEGLDSPHSKVKNTESHDIVENAIKSIKKLVSEQKSASKANIKNDIKLQQPLIPEESIQKFNDICLTDKTVKHDQAKVTTKSSNEGVISLNETKAESNQDNTIEEFENIYKDITAPRATEFDLLITQETSIVTNEAKETKTSVEETKYKLRNKSHTKDLRFADKVNTEETEEVLLESHAKCESNMKPTKRSLRLRRRKNQIETEDKSDQEKDIKLKDIVNLQKEFSDVCLDVPAPVKEVRDIESPKKTDGEDENLPPLLGIQSCPSKSVTRSRRKLFTPRAEPLDEGEAPEDSGERLYVPRPSYHRARARRKL
ncbi:hypothetical protein evm_006464 [Chilo suppressalis]|nr:hypothetical protein evm_006464 [Chilo suppressalis]